MLFFGAIFLYAKVINDSPDEFTAADLDAALVGRGRRRRRHHDRRAARRRSPPRQPPGADRAAEARDHRLDHRRTGAGASQWVATDASQVGYRVQEVLFGVDTTAVGRTNQVDRHADDRGHAGDGRRLHGRRRLDHQRREPPRQPVPWPDHVGRRVPDGDIRARRSRSSSASAPADGAEVTTHGHRRPDAARRHQLGHVDVTAKQDNGLIGVQGSIPVVFNDYGIANPSNGGVTTEDNGLVEFVLVFQPAA